MGTLPLRAFKYKKGDNFTKDKGYYTANSAFCDQPQVFYQLKILLYEVKVNAKLYIDFYLLVGWCLYLIRNNAVAESNVNCLSSPCRAGSVKVFLKNCFLISKCSSKHKL